jgi:hypothetical protein
MQQSAAAVDLGIPEEIDSLTVQVPSLPVGRGDAMSEIETKTTRRNFLKTVGIIGAGSMIA